jgi:hypothetical protein
MKRPVRFFEEGGHDAGRGDSADVPGQDHLISDKRFVQLADDVDPYDTLRSPFE